MNEITPASIGRLLRVMMVCQAITIWQATGTGSTTVVSGPPTLRSRNRAPVLLP